MGDSDRISLMLDSMLTAVDEGFSFDGIVSVPKTGLEDIVYRPGLVGLLHNCWDLVRKAARSIRDRPPPEEQVQSEEVDEDGDPEPRPIPSPRDSGISSTQKSSNLPPPPEDPASIVEEPESSAEDLQVSPQDVDNGKQPRKQKSGGLLEVEVRDDDQACDAAKNDPSHNGHQERKSSAGDEGRVSRDPRKKHCGSEEGLAPNVGHSGTEMQPRKKQ